MPHVDIEQSATFPKLAPAPPKPVEEPIEEEKDAENESSDGLNARSEISEFMATRTLKWRSY